MKYSVKLNSGNYIISKKSSELVLLLMFLLTQISSGQTPDWSWMKGIGGIRYEEITGMKVDFNGDLVVAGYFASPYITFGNIVLSNVDSTGYTTDCFIVKYDNSGNVIWAKSYGNEHDDLITSLTVDESGYIYVTGCFHSKSISLDTFVLLNSDTMWNYSDGFIAKTNPAGNVIWVEQVKRVHEEQNMQVKAVDDGYLYVIGNYYDSSITFGNVTVNNSSSINNADIFVAKYDTSGTLLWVKSLGGINTELIADLISNESGIYIAGTYNSDLIFDGFILPNSDTTGIFPDLYLARLDDNADVLWIKHAGLRYSYEEINSLVADKSGNVYFAGNFDGDSISFNGVNISGVANDAFVSRYDSSGIMIWVKGLNAYFYRTGESISLDSLGNIFIAGIYNRATLIFGSDTLYNMLFGAGTHDVFVAELDTLGMPLWGKSIGGIESEYLNKLTLNNNGDCFVAGTFQSLVFYYDSDSLLKTPGGAPDLFIGKTGAMSNIQEEQTELYSYMFVYPVPSNGLVNITCSDSISDLTITNSLGQIVLHLKPDVRDVSVFIGTNGIYIATVITEHGIQSKKFVVLDLTP